MRTIYDLTDDYIRLLEMAEDPDADEQAILDTMDALDGEFEQKADGYAKVLRQMDLDTKALRAEEDRISKRRQTLENRYKWLKLRLQMAMEMTGKTKFKTELFSFGIQRNPASVVIDNPAAVPKTFWIPQEPQFDKAGLKAFLKDEACDFAHLEYSQSLRIR